MRGEVGQALREAREAQGIELSEAERVTQIRVRFLRALESEEWEALPAPAYARNFLASYARYLGLDDHELLAEYRRTVEEPAEPLPSGPLVQDEVGPGRPSLRALAAVLAGLAALAVVVAIAGSLGGSDDERGRGERGAAAREPREPAADEQPGSGANLPSAPVDEVTVELRPSATVWVCLVDEDGRALVNGETLVADDARGPFEGRRFDMTLGNSSVELRIDGELAEIPPAAEPLGYRITTEGMRELDPAAQPTCV